MRTVVYTAEIDDRFGAGKVSSRIGLSSPARLYNPQTSLMYRTLSGKRINNTV
ncbi:hypothetical protein WP3W18C02_21130 [Klebsiella quasipneumoniae]|nr:hypothetical protein WP3W18C02_21130 [Klebsiella quasipneumoniae]BBR14784.1 hypothetical protein WP3S18E03_20420 [Klebsiella quasipneumoniae]